MDYLNFKTQFDIPDNFDQFNVTHHDSRFLRHYRKIKF